MWERVLSCSEVLDLPLESTQRYGRSKSMRLNCEKENAYQNRVLVIEFCSACTAIDLVSCLEYLNLEVIGYRKVPRYIQVPQLPGGGQSQGWGLQSSPMPHPSASDKPELKKISGFSVSFALALAFHSFLIVELPD